MRQCAATEWALVFESANAEGISSNEKDVRSSGTLVVRNLFIISMTLVEGGHVHESGSLSFGDWKTLMFSPIKSSLHGGFIAVIFELLYQGCPEQATVSIFNTKL